MPALALVLILQAAAVTPVPTPTPTAAPTRKKTPVAASGAGTTRTLSDVAREIKIRGREGETAPKPASLTIAPAAGGIGGGDVAAASATPPAAPAAGSGAVVVESAGHDNSVGSSGQVRVFGTVRNAGEAPVCDVAISVRLYDTRGGYLVSGAGRLDEPLLRPGGRSSFSVTVQVPPGVAGSFRDKDLSLAPGNMQGSVTLEGTWRTLGRAEAEVVSAADSCPGEKSPPAAREPEPSPAQTPTPPPL